LSIFHVFRFAWYDNGGAEKKKKKKKNFPEHIFYLNCFCSPIIWKKVTKRL